MQIIPFANLRRSQREATTISVTLVVPSEGSKVDHEAHTIDISVQGVRVRTALELFPGEQVGVVTKGEFPHVSPTAMVWIPTRVVWVRGESGLWSIAGLEFLQTLPT
jgi:hypothetical protein